MSDHIVDPPPEPKQKREILTNRRAGILLLLSILVLILTPLMFGSGRHSESVVKEVETSRYTQTWPKSYDQTSCREWKDAMTPSQRWAGAAAMLTVARNKVDDGTGVPPDNLVIEFQNGVSGSCVNDVKSVASVAATYYLTNRLRFAP